MNTGYMRFMKEIGAFTRKTSFAIVGNEQFFKKEALLALTSKMKRMADLDEEYLLGDKTKVSRLDEVLNEYPMIGKYRLVVVEGPEKIRDLKKIAYWMADPADNVKTVFLFTNDEKTPPKGFEFDVVVICNDMGVDSKEFIKYVDYCPDRDWETHQIQTP